MVDDVVVTSQWFPPTGSTPSPETPRRAPAAHDDRSSTRAIVAGVAAIALGLVAIVVQNAYKLDTEKRFSEIRVSSSIAMLVIFRAKGLTIRLQTAAPCGKMCS